jgi:undecaprenyl-diphosphatase
MYRILWALSAAVVVIGLIIFVDEPFNRILHSWVSRDFQKFSTFFSNSGIFLFYAVFGALFGYARIAKNSMVDAYCRAYIKAQLIFSFALVRVLKIVIGRMRPGTGTAFNFFSLESRYNSFPSGHAADIFTGALILFMLLQQSKWHQWRHLPLIYAAVVAGCRITGGWHYPADVVGGAMIGIFGARFFLSRMPANPVPAPRPGQF